MAGSTDYSPTGSGGKGRRSRLLGCLVGLLVAIGIVAGLAVTGCVAALIWFSKDAEVPRESARFEGDELSYAQAYLSPEDEALVAVLVELGVTFSRQGARPGSFMGSLTNDEGMRRDLVESLPFAIEAVELEAPPGDAATDRYALRVAISKDYRWLGIGFFLLKLFLPESEPGIGITEVDGREVVVFDRQLKGMFTVEENRLYFATAPEALSRALGAGEEPPGGAPRSVLDEALESLPIDEASAFAVTRVPGRYFAELADVEALGLTLTPQSQGRVVLRIAALPRGEVAPDALADELVALVERLAARLGEPATLTSEVVERSPQRVVVRTEFSGLVEALSRRLEETTERARRGGRPSGEAAP